TPGRWDGPPRVVALGFHVAGARLDGPRDLFADVAFDAARRAASDLAEVMRRLGPFEPHRLPLDEVEFTTAMPAAAARLTTRWSPI
ncbi:MAG: fructose 1,6-bisphosphatase, partial [Chloroflexi bacterium]|nr:fructose 1,6-bisphosphatase [Chloroflexota bacterium]